MSSGGVRKNVMSVVCECGSICLSVAEGAI